MSCPICNRRKPERFCPAKGEKICAVCCGREREVTLDCPADCPYLIAAHRYEAEHRRPVPAEQVPYPDVEFPSDLIHEFRPVVSGLGYTMLTIERENASLHDADAMAALRALAEKYRTLGSGLYYERPPDAPLPHALYAKLEEFLAEAKRHQAEHAGLDSIKDTEIFHLLVFLLRVGSHNSNGRPLSRAFLGYLRAQYPPAPKSQSEVPRIIVP